MKIFLSIENPTPEVLQLLAGCDFDLADTAVAAPVAGSTPVQPREVDFGDAAPVETIIEPEAPSKQQGVDVGTPPADALIAKLDGQFKRAKTVTLKGGVQGSEGDYVTTAEGNEGLIAAVYRGRAVVVFEDGTAEELGASTLTIVDEDPAEPETPAEPEPAPAATGRRRRAEPEPEVAAEDEDEDPEFADVKKKAAAIDPGSLKAILAEFQMKSIEEFADLEGEDRTDFIEIIDEAFNEK
jgi:hypothetical protein